MMIVQGTTNFKDKLETRTKIVLHRTVYLIYGIDWTQVVLKCRDGNGFSLPH